MDEDFNDHEPPSEDEWAEMERDYQHDAGIDGPVLCIECDAPAYVTRSGHVDRRCGEHLALKHGLV